MLKKDLRESGYTEEEIQQKNSVITAIWVITAFFMMSFVFGFTILINKWKKVGGDLADFMDDLAFMFHQIFQRWWFLVYILLWALIFLTLFFITKRNLRDQNAYAPPKVPKRHAKYILRMVLALLIIAATFYFLTMISEVPENAPRSGSTSSIKGFDLIGVILGVFASIGPLSIFVYTVFWELLYLVLKCAVTKFVCHKKSKDTHLTILKDTSMPVCSCKEAFSLRHVLFAYLLPFAFMYSTLLLLCATADDVAALGNYMITAIFMSFFMSYDLTLVFYSIYLKMRHKMDYISINRHIYEVTLFKKSFIKAKNNR